MKNKKYPQGGCGFAKNVIHVSGVDEGGEASVNRRLSRTKTLEIFE